MLLPLIYGFDSAANYSRLRSVIIPTFHLPGGTWRDAPAND